MWQNVKQVAKVRDYERCFSLDHRKTNRQGNLRRRIFSLKYSSKCALKRLKRRGLALLASCFRRFIPGIAIYYYLARCNKFIPDLFPE